MQGVAGFESPSTDPGVHSAHKVAPQPAYVPVPHEYDETLSQRNLKGQAAKLDKDLPALHEVHGVAGLTSSSASPAVQNAHVEDPLAAYWPPAHASQFALLIPPGDPKNVPAGHAEHGPWTHPSVSAAAA